MSDAVLCCLRYAQSEADIAAITGLRALFNDQITSIALLLTPVRFWDSTSPNITEERHAVIDQAIVQFEYGLDSLENAVESFVADAVSGNSLGDYENIILVELTQYLEPLQRAIIESYPARQ